jgi:Rps23 Pro-64 3,4-dihydroxylase Tpa1-like proline 4-hydroxylase
MEKYLNLESINRLELNAEYKDNNPYPHIVIDNFLNEDVAKELVSYAKSLKLANCTSARASKRWAYKPNQKKPKTHTGNKYGYSKIENFPENIQSILKSLTSNDFVKKLEHLTGINDLISNNVALAGAGFHKILNHGFLNLHTDFNNYTDKNLGSLDRRINLLVYLNPDWKEEYGGHLWLCNKKTKKIGNKVLPILNRCVIFSTTNKSIHGHPESLSVPKHVTRDSLALYYYTKNNNNNKRDFENDKFRATVFYKTQDFS